MIIYKAGFSVSRLKYIKKIYFDKTLIFCKYLITETIISEFWQPVRYVRLCTMSWATPTLQSGDCFDLHFLVRGWFMLEYRLVLEREIHVAGGRFMFEGEEVHVGGGDCKRESPDFESSGWHLWVCNKQSRLERDLRGKLLWTSKQDTNKLNFTIYFFLFLKCLGRKFIHSKIFSLTKYRDIVIKIIFTTHYACRNAHLKLTLVTGIIKGFINASNNQFVNRILRWYTLPALTVKSVWTPYVYYTMLYTMPCYTAFMRIYWAHFLEKWGN